MFGMGVSFSILGFYFQTLEDEKENAREGKNITTQKLNPILKLCIILLTKNYICLFNSKMLKF